MSASAFPSSEMGIPVALKYDLPPSMSDSARSYSVNVSPDGITSVTGPAMTTTAFVNGDTGKFGNFSSQIVSFTIPSGMSDSVFMDPTATTLSFTLTYTVSGTAASIGGTNPSINLIGSAASWFDQLVLYSNNVPIETINQYGLLQNFLLQNTVNQSERVGGISVAMGADTNSANGMEIGFSSTASGGTSTLYRYNFCIPLLSVIGVNTDKFIPIGSINNLQLQMTTANIMPLVSYCNGTVTTNPTFSAFTLSEFSLNMKYVDVGDMAAALLRQTLKDGKWFIKSVTYTNSAVTIPSGSAGSQQLLLQIRNSSVKSIIHQFGTSQSVTCPNGYYDAINPCLNTRQCQVGGQFYPNKPINDLQRPAEGYTYLIQSLGGGIAKSLGTVVSREMYNTLLGPTSAATLYALGADSYCQYTSAATRVAPSGIDAADANVTKYPSSAYYGYDLEKTNSGTLFSGVNTRASPPFLNLFLALASTSSIICQAWGMSDVILSFDSVSKQVTAFI